MIPEVGGWSLWELVEVTIEILLDGLLKDPIDEPCWGEAAWYSAVSGIETVPSSTSLAGTIGVVVDTGRPLCWSEFDMARNSKPT